MTRFTIRDVFWLTLVVGMGVGWWVTYRQKVKVTIDAMQLRESLRTAKRSNDSMSKQLQVRGGSGFRIETDWSLIGDRATTGQSK